MDVQDVRFEGRNRNELISTIKITLLTYCIVLVSKFDFWHVMVSLRLFPSLKPSLAHECKLQSLSRPNVQCNQNIRSLSVDSNFTSFRNHPIFSKTLRLEKIIGLKNSEKSFAFLTRAIRKDAKKSEEEESLDPDLRAGLNEVSTEAVKVMLSEDIQLLTSFKEKIEYLGEYLVQENEMDAARFMLVVRGMLDHKVVPEMEDLQGPYKKAFEKIGSILEDSGWLLTLPGEENQEEEEEEEEIYIME